MESACPNVFYFSVYCEGHSGYLFYRFFTKGNPNALSFKQRFVLLRQSVLWFGQDAYKILFGKVCQFDTDRKAPLEFRNQVGGFGNMERARGDEQDVVGLDDPVFCIHRTSFHNGEKVALDTLTADVGTTSTLLRT